MTTQPKPRGGRKYLSPVNMPDRLELKEILVYLDVVAFRKFIKDKIPDLVKEGWHELADEALLHLMHEYRSHYLALGDECKISRNVLRAEQFFYSPEEAALKPLCAKCVWFRTPPEDEEKACMHLGVLPEDICCPGFLEAK